MGISRKNDGEPGIVVIWRGWNKLQEIWSIMQTDNAGIDRCRICKVDQMVVIYVRKALLKYKLNSGQDIARKFL